MHHCTLAHGYYSLGFVPVIIAIAGLVGLRGSLLLLCLGSDSCEHAKVNPWIGITVLQAESGFVVTGTGLLRAHGTGEASLLRGEAGLGFLGLAVAGACCYEAGLCSTVLQRRFGSL